MLTVAGRIFMMFGQENTQSSQGKAMFVNLFRVDVV